MSQRYCCVPRCPTTGGKGIPMYKFPNPLKKMDLFKTWKNKIGGEINNLETDYIFQNRRVCRRHFDQVYIYPKKLCALAVPTLCLPGETETFLEHNSTDPKTSTELITSTGLATFTEQITSTEQTTTREQRTSTESSNSTESSTSTLTHPSINSNLGQTIVVQDILNRCRCCLSARDLMSMCEVNEHYGEKEIYAEMLSECFGFEWPFEIPELICERCVPKLREALKFKKVILATQEILNEGLSTMKYSVKFEEIEETDTQIERYEEVEYLDCDTNEDTPTFPEVELATPMKRKWQKKYLTSDTLSIKEEKLPIPLKRTMKKENITSDIPTINEKELPIPSNSKLQKENATSLKLTIKEEELPAPMKRKRLKKDTSDTISIEEEESPTGKKRKWPKKKIRSERNKTYKQYTQRGLKEAIKLVKAGQMSVVDAAQTYGIPKNTLSVKVNTADDKDVDEVKEANNVKHYKLIEEIKTLLLYTNAVPFRTRTTRYYCFYCSTDGPTFEEPDELRDHTRNVHLEEGIDNLEHYMTPQWMNEVIKLDINGLQCNSCSVVIPDWNKVFEHFALVHNIEFDEAYKKVIPYELASELTCILCNEAFHNYGHLDSHMNSHYPNYICYMCGDTFLAATRLDKHLKVHKVGSYPCEKCDKVFTLEKYRAKHFTLVHVQDSNVKCLYCPAKFLGTFQRHKHVLEKHKDKVKNYTCEVCGKSFTWKPYFFTHMRRKHNAEKEFKCNYCDKSFTRNYELKNHELRHTSDKKIVCGLCGEIYTKMMLFRRHMQTHIDDGQDTENSS